VGFFGLLPNAGEVCVAVAVKLGGGDDGCYILGGEAGRPIKVFFKSLVVVVGDQVVAN
jgi:hypothetical protein